MKSGEIRTKEDNEILFELRKTRQELFDLRMKASIEGASGHTSKIKSLRRTVARMVTVLRERKLGVRGQSPR